MILEILAGAGLALICVLVWQGINVAPVVVLAVMFALLYHFAGLRNGGKTQFSVVEAGESSGLVKFDQIGGQRTAKKELLEALDFIRHPERVATMGIRPLKGILLAGPNGKTLLAVPRVYRFRFFIPAAQNLLNCTPVLVAVYGRFSKARSTAVKRKKNSAIIFDEIEILGGKGALYRTTV